MKRFLFLFLVASISLQGQVVLGPYAKISLITCGPSQAELYSAFGHSAVRVQDPSLRMDLVFNYGTFDFNQPNFYLNFARGHLLYQLSVSDFPRFLESYRSEGRFVHEQVLNLDSVERQAYFSFLRNNAQAGNRQYLYDYFFDNCATRIRNGLEQALGSEVQISFDEETHYQPSRSIRQLCDEYLGMQPWGDIGIDICLGLPMDQIADYRVEMYLPDLLEYAFADGTILSKGQERPLVRDYKVLLEQNDTIYFERYSKSIHPFYVFGALLALIVLITILAYNSISVLRFLDGLVFGISGFLGLFLMILWFFTDHKAAAWNFNILLFLPSHLLMIGALFKGRLKAWQGKYMSLMPYFYALLLATWMFLPQQLNLAFIPWAAILILRSWHVARKYPKV